MYLSVVDLVNQHHYKRGNKMKTSKTLQPYINALINQIHINLVEGRDTASLEAMVMMLLRESNKDQHIIVLK